MALHRRSWTTKPAMALTVDTLEEADRLARVLLTRDQYLGAHLTWVGSQGGYVIHNEAGTKMVADTMKVLAARYPTVSTPVEG